MTPSVPQALTNAKEAEKIFGVPPIIHFNRHFSAMIQKARIKPREAISHSLEAQHAVNIAMVTRGREKEDINSMFRSARTKISQGMYSGLLYTSRRIARDLEEEGFGVSANIKGGFLNGQRG